MEDNRLQSMNIPATQDPAVFDADRTIAEVKEREHRAELAGHSSEELIEKAADSLTLLGQSRTEYPKTPEEAKLECIPNAFEGKGDYVVTLDCPEFTSLCPKTGQPDFARITITYTPDKLLIESKALKLYLFAFRNHGMFHEFCVNKIAHDLFDAMRPKSITVTGNFLPRGGISIIPTVTLPNREWLQRQHDALSQLDEELRHEVDPAKLLPDERGGTTCGPDGTPYVQGH